MLSKEHSVSKLIIIYINIFLWDRVMLSTVQLCLEAKAVSYVCYLYHQMKLSANKQARTNSYSLKLIENFIRDLA